MSEIEEALEDLRWQRLRVVLRNRRNAYAREHPYFVFKAIFKWAAREAGSIDFLFRPSGQPLPSRVTRSYHYALDVVFPAATCEEIEQFAKGLRTQLNRQPRNFELEGPITIQSRSLQSLRTETLPRLDIEAPEICLDFVTPLSFHPWVDGRPWVLQTADLINLCSVHVARLFPSLPWPISIPSGKVWSLPYFWEPISGSELPIRHRSKSQPGHERLEGYIGPLFLRGEWQALLPLLLLCSELHTGYGKGDEHALQAQRHARHRIANGLGGFELRSNRTVFDRLITDPSRFQNVRRALAQESVVAEKLRESFDGGEALAASVHKAVREKNFTPSPVRIVTIKKKSGEKRTFSLLSAADRILHGVLHNILADSLDRMFEISAVGFRPGRSIASARILIRKAIARGAAYAVRADVEAFFDEIGWELMEERVRASIPVADELTIEALRASWSAPIQQGTKVQDREKGLLQGSPIRPMLANLFLDPFDEAMQAAGSSLIRYGDDFLILTATVEEAHEALARANTFLEQIGLRLHPEKTAITPLDFEFTFLGMELPGRLEEEHVERASLRKPLHIRQPRAFTGLDGRSIVVRQGKELQARLPLERVGEIVFFGDGAVSQRLLQTCAEDKIPVSFCSPTGWHSCTSLPDSRAWFGRIARHHHRFDELGEDGRLNAARRIVEAKLLNYLAWIQRLPGAPSQRCQGVLKTIVDSLPGVTGINVLRGLEGSGARAVFPFLNRRIIAEEFLSLRRVPRMKPDRYNALLDFLYSRLFTRINVLVRNAGLDPYLGFLHSTKDDYESLVCDLQEPFRPRMDQLALKIINRREITGKDFVQGENENWRLTSQGVGTLLEIFAREENVRLAREPSTFGQLLAAQVFAVREWVEQKADYPPFFLAKSVDSKRSKTQDPS